MNKEETDFEKIELNTEYVAKDKFGFRISYLYPFIIVYLEIYDVNKAEIIGIFKKLVGQIYEDNKEKGIEKVFLVDSEDVRKQIAKNKNRIKNREDLIIEVTDLLTGEFVPLFSKVKELDLNKGGFHR